MHAPVSSVDCGLCEKPSALKKAIDFGRSATGRLMITCLLIDFSFVSVVNAERIAQMFGIVKDTNEGRQVSYA